MKAKVMDLLVWVVVDEDGNYAVGKDGDEAADAYRGLDGVAEEAGQVGVRRVKVSLTVPLPEPVQLSATVTADEAATALVAAKVA